MEITGNGEVKGLDSAQGMPMWNGARQDWASSASGIQDTTCEGRYMGERNPTRPLFSPESYGPMTPLRSEGIDNGTWKMGAMPK